MKSSIYCTRCLVLYSIVGNTISLSSSENESENDENTDGDVADCAFESLKKLMIMGSAIQRIY